MTINVLFVCLGNICRSPTAHGIFQKKVTDKGLDHHIKIDSAGTGDWHIGHAPDPRAQEAAKMRGYDLSSLRARLVTSQDFENYHYVIAMDQSNLKNLEAMKPSSFSGHLGLLLEFADSHVDEVPDPYQGGKAEFDYVLDLVENACDQLLLHIEGQLAE